MSAETHAETLPEVREEKDLVAHFMVTREDYESPDFEARLRSKFENARLTLLAVAAETWK